MTDTNSKNKIDFLIVVFALFGLGIGFFLNSYFSQIVDSQSESTFGLILLFAIPVLFVFFALFASLLFGNTSISPYFVAFYGGVEIGLAILGLRILMAWYHSPEIAHLEPAFVAVTVAFALWEYCRRMLSDFEKDDEQ